MLSGANQDYLFGEITTLTLNHKKVSSKDHFSNECGKAVGLKLGDNLEWTFEVKNYEIIIVVLPKISNIERI